MHFTECPRYQVQGKQVAAGHGVSQGYSGFIHGLAKQGVSGRVAQGIDGYMEF